MSYGVKFGKGVKKCLRDIFLHSKTLEEHFDLVCDVLRIWLETGY